MSDPAVAGEYDDVERTGDAVDGAAFEAELAQVRSRQGRVGVREQLGRTVVQGSESRFAARSMQV